MGIRDCNIITGKKLHLYFNNHFLGLESIFHLLPSQWRFKALAISLRLLPNYREHESAEVAEHFF